MPPSPASTAAPDARLRMESASNPQAADAIASASELRDLTLVVQRLIPLRPRAETRRYEVLLRSRQQPTRKTLPNVLLQAMTASDSACAIDRYVLTKLVSWLGQHRSAWQSDAISFSIGVAHSTLADESFLPWAATLFEQWVVPPAVVGFEIAQRACIEAPGQIRAFIDTCESTGFFFILEDFSMHSAAVPFLASPALRLIKMDSRLTSSAMTSKLPEALVIAMSQAAKVLDVRYAAKHIDSRITAKWLAARGIDCAQGHALEQLGSIDSLLVATGDARPAESAVR
jgi:EAL domain-containing protein (putative c-di-GMP-specific phosphodiesterase class I)